MARGRSRTVAQHLVSAWAAPEVPGGEGPGGDVASWAVPGGSRGDAGLRSEGRRLLSGSRGRVGAQALISEKGEGRD